MQRFLDGDYIRLIARLTRFEQVNNEELRDATLRRTVFEFDAIDANIPIEDVQREIEGDTKGQRLALVTILTTRNHFLEITNEDQLEEGWFFLEFKLRSNKAGSLAWGSALDENGYLESTPLSLVGGRRILEDESRPLLTLSASVTSEVVVAQKISKACEFPKTAVARSGQAKTLLSTLPRAHKAIVHDVGQASFSSLVDDKGGELLHLDAGWPIPYNMKTAPKKKPIITNHSAPVLLSHWDWDHLHGYYAFDGLKKSVWIAPIQRLGPGSARVANILAKGTRLLGIARTILITSSIKIGRCKVFNDLNNSGLAFRVELASKKALLYVGDADYVHLQGALTAPVTDFLVVTHHGADFKGAVPASSAPKSASVVSVGFGNRYRHPSTAAINQHDLAGWDVRYTYKSSSGGRGDRQLGP